MPIIPLSSPLSSASYVATTPRFTKRPFQRLIHAHRPFRRTLRYVFSPHLFLQSRIFYLFSDFMPINFPTHPSPLPLQNTTLRFLLQSHPIQYSLVTLVKSPPCHLPTAHRRQHRPCRLSSVLVTTPLKLLTLIPTLPLPPPLRTSATRTPSRPWPSSGRNVKRLAYLNRALVVRLTPPQRYVPPRSCPSS